MRATVLLIGIDEAGYGPRIGPLCHGYSAIRCRDDHPTPPDLWKLLHPSVMRVPGFAGSTIVDDSKKVHGSPGGKELLARGIRAFLSCAPGAPETSSECLNELYVRILPEQDRIRLEEDEWCTVLAQVEQAEPLPEASPEEPSSEPSLGKPKRVSKSVAALGPAPEKIPPVHEALSQNGITVMAVGARGMSAKHYNTVLRSGKNKADVNWSVIADQFLKLVTLAQPGEPIHAVIDRQGGRKFYAAKVGDLFPGAMPWTESETPTTSVYRIDADGRTVRVAFMVDADGQTLPVALGSMAAKLARELCMKRLNDYFRRHEPQLKPTAGYYGDASRFLRETRGLRKKLKIPNAALIRLK
jgi:hypothetical protein